MGSLGSGTVRPFNKAPSDFKSPTRMDGYFHTLHELVDYNAIHNASHPFCIQGKSGGELDTFTHGDFKVAVSNCVAWLKKNLKLGASANPNGLTKNAPVALFMESNFGLVVHEFALLALGIPPLVLSVRLAPNAIMHLLKTTGASSFIVSQRLSGPAKGALGALQAAGIDTFVGEPYTTWVADKDTVDLASLPTFEIPQNLDDICLLLHSSGTTGLPKPIPISHRMLMFSVSTAGFDTEEEAQGLNVSSLPLFHGLGLVAPGMSMAVGKTTVYPASDGIPNIISIIELIKATNARSLMTVPFLLDDVVNNEEGLKVLAGLDFVGTGGAALGAGVGDKLAAAGIKLLNFYGTTETGPLSLVFVPKDNYDWKYFRLRTDVNYSIADLEPKDGQKRYRLTVRPFGDAEPFEISDQLIRNDEYPETDFAAVGRDDDIIILATGEKANPLILETMLTEAPQVKCAIAFGENQFNLGVVVEPAQPLPEGGEEAFKDSLWPIVEAAGQKVDAYSVIPSKEAIVVVPNGVRVPRTDKGSIARKEVYALFAEEMKAVYENLAKAVGGADLKPLDLASLEADLKALVLEHSGLKVPADDVTSETSLFDLGLDSLQALKLRRVLTAAAGKTDALKSADLNKLIPPEFVYLNPSVGQMASALKGEGGSTPGAIDPNAHKAVTKFAEEYALAGSATEEKGPSAKDNLVVVLTGSSGSLGSHAAASLAKNPKVRKVVCLTRKGAAPFDKAAFEKRGITLSEEQWAKLANLEVDPTADKLGLDDMSYGFVQSTVTHVVHTAWPMNYLTTVPAFKYQFQFLRGLLQLATGGQFAAKRRFVFVSSIAAVAKLALANGGSLITERPVSAEEAANGIGYADGKLVCEKILEKVAVSHAGSIEVTSVRCGQMTGSRASGAWNADEQIPMIFRTAQNLGVLPYLPGVS
jgi:acyl-coenzyme A synthetase/AMP-(fatty) acid ligase/nucleoside-diphosphate-sugar epimerase